MNDRVVALEIDIGHEDEMVVFEPGSSGLDFALLVLKEGEYSKAFETGYYPVRLGDNEIEPLHELNILHHPDGKKMVLTQRYCRSPTRPEGPTEAEFLHLCDTLPGSSGAPVFSKDHSVVVGIHTCCSHVFGGGAEDRAFDFNRGVRVNSIASKSDILRDLVSRNPLTAEQRTLVTESRALAKQMKTLSEDSQTKLALIIGQQFLDRISRRSDNNVLYPLMAELHDSTLQTMSILRETVNLVSENRIPFSHAEFSRDGDKVVAGFENGSIRVWDTANSEFPIWTNEHPVFEECADLSAISFASFGNDDQYIVSVSENGSIGFWTLGGRLFSEFQEHQRCDRIVDFVFSEDAGVFVTVGDRSGAKVWSVDNNFADHAIELSQRQVNSVAMHPKGDEIYIGTGDGSVFSWHTTDRKLDRIAIEAGQEIGIVDYNDETNSLVYVTYSGSLKLIDLDTNAVISEFTHGELGDEIEYVDAAFSPDGRHIITGGSNFKVRIWDRTGVEKTAFNTDDFIYEVGISADGSTAMARTLSKGGAVHTFAITDRKVLFRDSHTDEVTSSVFSDDGTQIITAAKDGLAIVWDLGRVDNVRDLETGRPVEIDYIEFSPSETRLLIRDRGRWRFHFR